MLWVWVAPQNNTPSGINNAIEHQEYTRCGISVMKNKKPQALSGIVTPLSLQVKAMRKAARLTQAEMAKRTGVGLRFMRDVEQGKPSVRLDKVNQVLVLFGYHTEAVKDHETSA